MVFVVACQFLLHSCHTICLLSFLWEILFVGLPVLSTITTLTLSVPLVGKSLLLKFKLMQSLRACWDSSLVLCNLTNEPKQCGS